MQGIVKISFRFDVGYHKQRCGWLLWICETQKSTARSA